MVRLYYTVRLLQIFLPQVGKAFIGILSLTGLALSIVWKSINDSSMVLADSWVDRAVGNGFETIYSPQLYWCVRILAFLMMLAAWLLAAHLTVFMTRIIF